MFDQCFETYYGVDFMHDDHPFYSKADVVLACAPPVEHVKNDNNPSAVIFS
jgi:hypothetical protein